MQVMCIEFARHVLQSDEPNSTEFDAQTEHPVISLMPDQHELADMGGTMRLGAYPCDLVPGTKAATAYGESSISERHRHRWEFNNAYREVLEAGGPGFQRSVTQRPSGRDRRTPGSSLSCSAASSTPNSRADPIAPIRCSMPSWKRPFNTRKRGPGANGSVLAEQVNEMDFKRLRAPYPAPQARSVASTASAATSSTMITSPISRGKMKRKRPFAFFLSLPIAS